MARFAKLDLLILDELGFIAVDQEGATLLFQLDPRSLRAGFHRDLKSTSAFKNGPAFSAVRDFPNR